MRAGLDVAVELLDRSLAYTCGALAGVTDDLLARPTPCRSWDLAELLAHMEDALDAFLEAAGGLVAVGPADGGGSRVEVIRGKANRLLGAWVAARPGPVRVGDVDLDAGLLVGTAALEVAVHGWDVARATGRELPVPEGLAEGLLAVAVQVVGPADRGTRFGAPVPVHPAVAAHVRLLAFLGRG